MIQKIFDHMQVWDHWPERISEEKSLRLKRCGTRLLALLLQYNGRLDGGEIFLEEGKRITHAYSQACAQSGYTLQETVRFFLFFRRAILDSIHQAGSLGGSTDLEGQRLFHRTNHFLDELMLNLIDCYLQTPEPIPDVRTKLHANDSPVEL